MTDKLKSDYVLGVVLWFIAAQGAHWLITPANHPAATTFQYVWVWGQIIVCGIAGWRLMKRSQPPASAS